MATYKATTSTRRTQAQRRNETRSALIASACVMFGERGYAGTSLEDIAEACGLTIRPIYYHFGNKRGLYQAVNELLEQRAIEALSCQTSIEAWASLLALCKDPAFVQVIFEDAPNVLGRERWLTARRLPWNRSLALQAGTDVIRRRLSAVMSDRVALAALMEAAMYVIECGENSTIEQEAMQLISRLLPDEATAGEPSGFGPSMNGDRPNDSTQNKKEITNAK